MKLSRRNIIFASMCIIIALIIYSISEYNILTINTLQTYKESIKWWTEHNYKTAIFIYYILYTSAVSLAIPASPFTILGGYLFGFFQALGLVMISATSGASLVFLVARYFWGKDLQSKYKERLQNFNNEMERNGLYYLLTLRLSFFVPFFLVNILAGLTRMPYRTFAIITFFGVAPVSAVYIYAGSQLQSMTSYKDALSPQLIIVLCILACLALAPVVLKKIRG